MNGLNHWGVDVRVNHKHILTIESNCMSGKPDLSDIELEAIRIAGEHLLSFSGRRKDDGYKGPTAAKPTVLPPPPPRNT